MRALINELYVVTEERAGRLVEIAERDLRFTADEAAQLVGDRERGDRLATQTQGWTIAVRLGASLAASGGVSFDTIFAGVRDHAFDFLAQEVVAPLAPGDRNDLMTIAIPASFGEATATMLLGCDDTAAAIERLVARGVYLENSQAAWQFHELFREFL